MERLPGKRCSKLNDQPASLGLEGGPSLPPILKVTPFAWAPFAVTITNPLVAFAGTIAVMDVADQAETWATMPLKVTVLEPCTVPKPMPVMTTLVPAAPRLGDSEEIERLAGVAWVCAVLE